MNTQRKVKWSVSRGLLHSVLLFATPLDTTTQIQVGTYPRLTLCVVLISGINTIT